MLKTKIPISLMVVLLTCSVTFPLEANELKVLAPREFKKILGELGEFFRGKSTGWEVNERFASQKDIENQIVSTWTSDVLILSETAAVQSFLKRTVTSGEYVRPFLSDPAVIVSRDSFKESIQSPKGLVYEGLKKVALCGKRNSFGKQTFQYLETHQLLEGLKDRIVETKDVDAALKLLSAGSVEWTFARRSQVAGKSALKIIWSIPEDEIAPERYFLVARVNGEKAPGTRIYLECLRSTIASKLFENAGFLLVTADSAGYPSQQ